MTWWLGQQIVNFFHNVAQNSFCYLLSTYLDLHWIKCSLNNWRGTKFWLGFELVKNLPAWRLKMAIKDDLKLCTELKILNNSKFWPVLKNCTNWNKIFWGHFYCNQQIVPNTIKFPQTVKSLPILSNCLINRNLIVITLFV